MSVEVSSIEQISIPGAMINYSDQEMAKAKQEIEKINKKLRDVGLAVTIRIKGQSLYIRFTTDPKPGSTIQSRQHDYPVGAKAVSPAGRKKAENLAKEIGGKLANRTFVWCDYLPEAIDLVDVESEDSSAFITCGEAVQQYEKDYFDIRARNPTTEYSFKNNYSCLKWLTRLLQDQPLNQENLEKIILQVTPPDQFSRRHICNILESLGAHFGMHFNFSRLKGKYSVHGSAKPRQYPEDSLIEKWFFSIADPKAQFVFGFMVVYGLRPHEFFYIDFDEFRGNFDKNPHGLLRILNAPYRGSGGIPLSYLKPKTGSRIAFAYHPKWIKLFDLKNPKVPVIKPCSTNSEYGSTLRKYLKGTNVLSCSDFPYSLYDLRHSWAIRAKVFGLPDVAAAKSMGHSLEVHQKVYLRWFSEDEAIKQYLDTIDPEAI